MTKNLKNENFLKMKKKSTFLQTLPGAPRGLPDAPRGPQKALRAPKSSKWCETRTCWKWKKCQKFEKFVRSRAVFFFFLEVPKAEKVLQKLQKCSKVLKSAQKCSKSDQKWTKNLQNTHFPGAYRAESGLILFVRSFRVWWDASRSISSFLLQVAPTALGLSKP